MKITWVEKLAEAGVVSDKAKLDIYADVQKLANQEPSLAEDVFNMVMGPAVTLGAGALFAKVYGSRSDKKTRDQVAARREMLNSDFSKKDLPKAQARYDEITRFVPSLAKHPDKINSLIKSRLHSGLSSDDMINLIPVEAALRDPHFARQEKEAEYNPQAARLAGEVCADMIALVTDRVGADLMKEAVDEGFSKEASKKTKLFSEKVKYMGMAASIPILMGIGAGAAKSIASAISNKKLSNQIRESYEQAMEMDKKDPDGGYLSQDKAKSLQAFKTLTHFAPQVAAEPLAAKTFMKKMVQMNDLQSSDVKDLTDIRKNITQSSEGSPFMQGFASGVDVGGLRGMLGSPVVPGKLSPMQDIASSLAAGE